MRTMILTAAALIPLAALGARALAADPPTAAAPPSGPGLDLINQRCIFCHNTAQIFSQHKSPEAWSTPASKLRTPQEFLWASARALQFRPEASFINRALGDLGEPLWNPPSPQGFKDDAATWLAPNAMTTRVDVAELVASRAKGLDDPRDLATDLFGAGLSSDTRTAIDRAESRNQAIALLLMSPEFQRR